MSGRDRSLLLSLVGFLACAGVAVRVGMPYARILVAFGVIQIVVVDRVTKLQEKKS